MRYSATMPAIPCTAPCAVSVQATAKWGSANQLLAFHRVDATLFCQNLTIDPTEPTLGSLPSQDS